MLLTNTTSLSTIRLRAMFLPHARSWRCDGLRVAVRWSRGADFSGSCRYDRRLITINLGRHLSYPYRLETHVARPQKAARGWFRPACHIMLGDPAELALFIFLHELYHWLVRQARRNIRRKEGMCDRFAARALVDDYGCSVRDAAGREVPRHEWDFQRLVAFVASARRAATLPC